MNALTGDQPTNQPSGPRRRRGQAQSGDAAPPTALAEPQPARDAAAVATVAPLRTLANTVRWCRPQRQRARGCCCFTPKDPPDRPDLATYSQEEQLQMGVAPSWDSPDIVTNYWNPFRLEPDTQVVVRNLSPKATAVNALVTLSFAGFGIGLARSPFTSRVVTLAPLQEATLLFPLTQAMLNAPDQRIATFVRIDHPYDSKLINNKGEQLLADAYTSAEGRGFSVTFPVVNQLAGPETIALTVLPNDLGASVSPVSRTFAALEQFTATLTIALPATLHGTGASPLRKDVTVVGRRGDGSLINGLTYVIWIDD